MHPPSEGDAYLPMKALAAYAGLSVTVLRQYLRHCARPLPHYRIGGKILVRRSEFDAWAAGFRSAARPSIDAIVAETLRGL